jgi:hypothetical protein
LEYSYNLEKEHFYYKPYREKRKIDTTCYKYAVYELVGTLEGIFDKLGDIKIDGYTSDGIRAAAKENRKYKKKYFLRDLDASNFPLQLDITPICWIDEIPFYTRPDIVQYLQISRQAVQQACVRKSKIIGGKNVIWGEENKNERVSHEN